MMKPTITTLIKTGTIAITALTTGALGFLIGALGMYYTHYNTQTVSQQIETTGDVKRLCYVVKTGDRIDAISCQLLNEAGRVVA